MTRPSERVYATTERHRHECEARHVAKLAPKARKAYLERVELRRGRLAAHKLRVSVNDLLRPTR